MTRILLAALIVSLQVGSVCAQKVKTVIGDAWTGEVVTTDDNTREIVIKFDDKGKSETFVGVLNEGYKVQLKDGGSHELKVSEIPIGERIRVFSKTKERIVGGQKVKINLIWRIDFVGKDDFARLREQLKVSPSIPVVLAESKDLPPGNPLNLYLAIEDEAVSQSIVEWVQKWNRDSGAKYGSIEVVSDLTKADVYLARYRGSRSLIEIFRTATIFLVVPKGDGLEVLWTQVVAIDPDQGFSPAIEKEVEKRMKARLKK